MIILSILATSFPDSTFNENIPRSQCRNENGHIYMTRGGARGQLTPPSTLQRCKMRSRMKP